jgi:hypothetical protein
MPNIYITEIVENINLAIDEENNILNIQVTETNEVVNIEIAEVGAKGDKGTFPIISDLPDLP